MSSIFQSRQHVWYKEQLQRDHQRIQEFYRLIRQAPTQHDAMLGWKQLFEYLCENPLSLVHHVTFRQSILRQLIAQKAIVRALWVRGHQAYHEKLPHQRASYQTDTQLRPLNQAIHRLERLIPQLPLPASLHESTEAHMVHLPGI